MSDESIEFLIEDKLCTIVTTASESEQTLSAATCRLNFRTLVGVVRRFWISREIAGHTEPSREMAGHTEPPDVSRSVTTEGASRRTSKALIALDIPA